MNAVPDLHVTSFDQLLACVPYLLGWHPRHAIVVIALDADGHISYVGHYRPYDANGVALEAGIPTDALAEATSCILVGYFDVDSGVDAIASTAKAWVQLLKAGVEVWDVLLVTGQLWTAIDCRAGRCGHDDHSLTRDHPTATQLAADGHMALHDRDAVAALLDPVAKDQCDAAADAFRAVAKEILSDGDAARSHADHAVDLMHAHAQPDRALPAVADIAVLAAATRNRGVVSTACRLVDADGASNARRYLELWRWVVRHLPGGQGDVAAALCAYAAWRAGRGALANDALQRCHRPDKLPLAEHMHHILSRGVPPSNAASFA